MRAQVSVLSILMVCGACEQLPTAAGPIETATVSQAVTSVAASDVSFSSGTTGLPGNVQDAITSLYNLDAEGSVPSLDSLDGRPCNGSKGISRLTYSDPSEVGDGPFTMSLRCLANHPVLAYNPSYWDYGTYSRDTAKYISVQNRGGVPVNISAVTCTGDCSKFVVSANSCTGTRLDTDRYCGFTVTYAPRNVPCGYYAFSATFKLTTDVPAGNANVYVRGSYLCIP